MTKPIAEQFDVIRKNTSPDVLSKPVSGQIGNSSNVSHMELFLTDVVVDFMKATAQEWYKHESGCLCDLCVVFSRASSVVGQVSVSSDVV